MLLRRLKAGGHKALIFTQMSKMLDVLEVGGAAAALRNILSTASHDDHYQSTLSLFFLMALIFTQMGKGAGRAGGGWSRSSIT